ncbi:MAG: type II toxin-antitoxin system RelE/ParE family toxin [Terrimicrobiaceae bacterium]
MKDFSVELSPRALRDLERVKREVSDASQSERVTADYLRRIAAEIDALGTMPSRFPFWKTNQKYRFLIAEKYLAFFQIEGMRVRVSHVRYAGRRPFRG